MRVEQAIYGEVAGRGHGLRASSTNAPIVASIASKLDLPDAVPPGVRAWSPFVRGFPIDDHYILARTFLDSSASRGGMVVSHALIVNLDDLCRVGNLASLFDQLAPSLTNCPRTVTTLEIDADDRSNSPAPDLVGTANALTMQGFAPAIRLGVEGFEHLVDSLWRNLWPTLRRSFAFRLSFGPKDLVEQPAPLLVCTPEQLQARWTQHRVIRPDDQAPDSASAEVLCGRRDLWPILTLADELGLGIHTLKELGRFDRLHRLLAGSGDFESLLAAIRLVDGLSGQPTLGTSIKDKLIDQFAALIPDADCKQVLPMRNLALPGFGNTQPIWSAVELLVSNLGFAPEDDSYLQEMVTLSIDESLALPAWRGAVKAGLSSAARQDNSNFFRTVWRWAEQSQAVFAATIGLLPTDGGIELRLVGEVPRHLKISTPTTLLSPLLKKRWLTAHGATLAAMMSPFDAIEQQLMVDTDPNHGSGLQGALRYARPSEVLACTLAHKDQRLVRLCVDLAIKQPQILSSIRCEEIIEQQLWGAVIGRNSSLWNAPSNPQSVRDTVLAQLADGKAVDTGLLKELVHTPLADLSATPVRERLWGLLPAPQCSHYMDATVIGWLDAAGKGAVGAPLEPPLESAIIANSHLLSVLERPTMAFDVCLAIINALPSFTENMFLPWLRNRLRDHRMLSSVDSERLGVLVASRRWKRVAEYLSERLAEHRTDLMAGLRVCAGLLPIFTRWLRGISEPSAEEKWCALEEEARELYPTGPDHNELWSRAGGKNSKLSGSKELGATRWHLALNSIRQGGRPSARELLAEMCDEFPSNEKLRLYANDADIVGRR